MRFGLRRVFLLVALAAIALTAYRWWPIVGIGDVLLAFICEEDTVWAEGYSNEAFYAARIGMSRDEIYSLLGPPIRTVSGNSSEVRECWTWSPIDGHYWRREIVFQGDKVVTKTAEFYAD